MGNTRVLIVDDAVDLLFLLKHSISRIGPEYIVETAMNGPSALKMVQEQSFDLVVCDYMMPGMTGIELADAIHDIAPKTQVIMMTAYDTRSLRNQIKDVKLDGYVGKPFSMDELLEMIERILNKTERPIDTEQTVIKDQQVYDHLKELHSRTSAYYVLLLDSEGRALEVAGQTDSATAARLAAFVAANFLAVTELASLLGDNTSTFKSSYHEGNNYSIYAHEVTKDHLLAVVFAAEARPGTIWFYTKKVAAELAPLLELPDAVTGTDDDDEAIATNFDTLISNRKDSERKP